MPDSLLPHRLKLTRLLCPWDFSRQWYWSGLPFPSPGYLPNPGIEPRSPALQADSLPTELQGKPHFVLILYSSFPGGARGKEPTCQWGDIWDVGWIPGLGRSPGGGHGSPLQYSCLENPIDRGAWRAAVHGVRKSQTQLKQLSMHAILYSLNVAYHIDWFSIICWTILASWDK